MITDGTGLATWGVDSARADRTLVRRYEPVVHTATYDVWARR